MELSNQRAFIIAEAGVNHNGQLEIAKKLVDAAKEAGADAIKFQTFSAERITCKKTRKANYQMDNTGSDEDQQQMLKKLQLSEAEFKDIKEYCDMKRIMFLSTPFDIESLYFLLELGVDFIKVPSGEVTNYPYLVEVAKSGKPIILSTGMCDIEEVSECYEVLKCNGAEDIVVLHCTTQYPTAYRDVNLNAMLTLKDTFGCPVGYSDHTEGILVPIAAVAMGACVIEKHFTLDRNMEGPDHKASLEPDELMRMVHGIRNIEDSMGDGIKVTQAVEEDNKVVARKSIVARRHIEKGELLTVENMTTKRPGNGISPMEWNSILGTLAIKDFEEDELIEV